MLKEDEEPIIITSAESLHRFPVSRTDPLLYSEPIKNEEHSRKVALFEFVR
jgi:hypothetical protein